MPKYYAIEINGSIDLFNGCDELGGLIDNDVPHLVLGEVCDRSTFGDNCNTTCVHYRQGTCPAVIIHDSQHEMWHVLMSDDIKRQFCLNND